MEKIRKRNEREEDGDKATASIKFIHFIIIPATTSFINKLNFTLILMKLCEYNTQLNDCTGLFFLNIIFRVKRIILNFNTINILSFQYSKQIIRQDQNSRIKRIFFDNKSLIKIRVITNFYLNYSLYLIYQISKSK